MPLALGLGFVMLTLGVTTVLVSQGGLNSSVQRRNGGAGFAVTEGGVARTLAQFTQPNNSVLLSRNYDTINQKTGKTYLGRDGIPNSGDENGNAIDEWTGYDPSDSSCFRVKGWGAPTLVTSGEIGSGSSYTIRAYRFDATQGIGTLLVEGRQGDQHSAVMIKLSVKPDLDDFPGVLMHVPEPDTSWETGVLALRGREILGSKGNVYFAPANSPDSSLTDTSAPEDSDRPNYLNGVWSTSANDGANGDTISGDITGCQMTVMLPDGIKGTNFGTINSSTTLRGVGGNSPTLYQLDKIDLAGADTLTVDTTGGPVYIDMTADGSHPQLSITLRDTAKILNVRTDGQAPRVGDLRIKARGDNLVRLYDQSCIQNAFLWIWRDELRLMTSGPGCPSGRNTNFEGVAWVEAILSSKNAASNRNVNFLGYTGQEYDTLVTPGATSGIAVPEDVSSLSDLLKYTDWPTRYRFGGVLNWQRIRL
ncbi:MAG: hypothetical protein AAF329_08430 [Cyanobacteria bacterium P01_A01_bin.17]